MSGPAGPYRGRLVAGHPGGPGPARPGRGNNGRAAGRPGQRWTRPSPPPRIRAGARGAGQVAGLAEPGDRASPGRRPGGELPVPRGRVRIRPGQDPAGLLPEVLALADRPGRGHHPPARRRVPRLRGRARPGHRRRPAGRHDRDAGDAASLRRRARGHQRRQRPADPAHQDAVLRGQVLSHLHPGRAVAGPGRRRGPGQDRLAAAHPQRQRRGPPGRAGRGDDRHPGPGADRAVEVPAAVARRPAAHRNPRRDRPESAAEGRGEAGRLAAAARSSGRCSSAGRRATPVTCATATWSRPASPAPTASSISAPSSAPSPGRRHDHARRCRAGVDV